MQPKSIFLRIIVGCGVALLFYGVARFPDAPFKACAPPEYSGEADRKIYCGKTGRSHTQVEFEAFSLWEKTLISAWPVVMLAAYFLYQETKAAKQKPQNLPLSKDSR